MRAKILALLAIAAASAAHAQTSSPAELNKRMMERRATEAVIWGMPAVNTARRALNVVPAAA